VFHNTNDLEKTIYLTQHNNQNGIYNRVHRIVQLCKLHLHYPFENAKGHFKQNTLVVHNIEYNYLNVSYDIAKVMKYTPITSTL
jgi:hypothetical protein